MYMEDRRGSPRTWCWFRARCAGECVEEGLEEAKGEEEDEEDVLSVRTPLNRVPLLVLANCCRKSPARRVRVPFDSPRTVL